MKYQCVYIDYDQHYSLGIDEEAGTYVLQVGVGRVFSYTAHFRLTPEEFHDYPNNKVFIDGLVESVRRGVNDENRDRHIMP